MKLIAIEGPIGSGKSTLISKLPHELNLLTGDSWGCIEEPTYGPEFGRLLKGFIDNPTDANKRAEFQLYLTRCRYDILKDIPDGNYVIERSLYSDLVFTQCNMLSTEGPSGEYQAAYYDIRAHLKTYPHVDAVVYLDRDSQACLDSVALRGRDGEDGYKIEYFDDLSVFHHAVLPQACREYGTKLVTLDLGVNYPDPKTVAECVLEML